MSSHKQTHAYYEEHASQYDQRTGFTGKTGQVYNYERYFDPFLAESLPSTGRVLEIGCGTGFYTRWLVDHGLDVVAMDLSSNMIEEARRRCPSDVSFFVGNCEEPASAIDPARLEGGFDFIVGVNTFSYYPNKAVALRNYRELLRENGRLVFLDVHGNAYTQRLAYLTNFRDSRGFAENINESTRPRLRALLEEAGFEVERLDPMTFMPNAVNRLGVMLIAPFDRLLSRLPLADAFAIRLAVVARKV